MNQRLYYRLLSGPMRVAPNKWIAQCDGERHHQIARKPLLRRIPKIIFDNVAEFYAKHDKQIWAVEDDIPNFAPPWGAAFIEWQEPYEWLTTTGMRTLPGGGQVGAMMIAAPVDDSNRGPEVHSLWSRFLGGVVGNPGGALITERFAKGLIEAKWVLVFDMWYCANMRPYQGIPVWLGFVYWVCVGRDGKAIDHGVFGVHEVDTLEKILDTESPLHILGLGFSFCHCKNVTISHDPVSANRKWHKQKNEPEVKFTTLKIGGIVSHLREHGQMDRVGAQRALHICRGHFAHYSEDAPLFGKYVGDFWRPDHTRGSRLQGEVVKDYFVTPTG